MTRYTLDELCALAGLPRRTVRFYVQRGLVDRPEGETRAARYGSKQLEQLLAIRKWQAAGVQSLDRIQELLASPADAGEARPRRAGTVEVWSHVVLDDGVELHVDAARARLSPEDLRRLLREGRSLLARIREDEDGKSR